MFLNLWNLFCSFFGRLANESGQIPSSVTDQYDALLSTTLRNYQTKLHDNITRGNKFLAWLDSKGRMRKVGGGHQISIPLMHQQNGTADIYSGYGQLDTTPQDGITTAFYDWAQMAVSITISRKEKRQNSGKAKILDLLQAKTMQAEVSLKELLNNCIVAGRITSTAGSDQIKARIGALDSGASGPLPLGALIDLNPTRAIAIGNINPNTYAFWANKVKNDAATTFIGFKNNMNGLYNDCSKGTGGNVDIILATQIYWETYWLALQQNERYLIDDKKTIDILGGSDGLKFRGATIVWDEVVPDPETPFNPVDENGTNSAAAAYFVNTETIEFITDTETDFITTDFVRPTDQDASTAQILWMGANTVNNRRKNGLHYGVSQSITA
jgi:hypothetical protein